MAGNWDVNNPPKTPGLYINFVETAKEKIVGGTRGIVAIPLKTFSGTAVADKVYEIDNENAAIELFGADNTQSIKFALQGGASKVLVYTLATIDATNGPTEAEVYNKARAAFDARPFDVFVFDGEMIPQHDETLVWVKAQREIGKHFSVVLGGDATTDADPALGNARTTLNSDDYIINLINGVEISGVEYTSSAYAPFIAGVVASVALNRSLTYTVLPVDDVTLRLTNTQVNDALLAGSLVFVHDGQKVKIVQGLATSGKKIRSVKTRQAVATDIQRTGEDSYVGKINNNADGQKALSAAIKAYLEELEANNVLTNIEVALDATASTGDSIFLDVAYDDIDSVERILLSINL
jgi:hypothetical protein